MPPGPLFPPITGGGGSGLVAIGTQPMAAARANGSHAATEAMLGAIVNGPQDEEQKVEKYTFSDKSFEHFYSVMRHTES